MRAGFYEADITPAFGMEKPGGYGKAYTAAVHDRLKVRAGVFGTEEDRVALVGLDTLCIPARTVAEIRAAIAERCGIQPDHVLMGCSHTHSGGPLFGLFADELEDAPELVRDLALKHSVCVDPVYHAWVVGQTVTAVCEAERRSEEAVVSVGRGVEDFVVANRRLQMTDGRACSHPGKGNPEIVEPAGPIDPEVGVLAAWRANGDLLGCVVNYTCHGTTFGGALSADWIHYLCTTIRGVMGAEAVPVFLNGACGDITQVDNRSLRERESGEKWSRMLGTRVGAEAVKVLVTAEKGACARVAALTEVLEIARRPPSAESLERCREIIAANPGGEGRDTEWTFAKERLILEYLVAVEPVVDVEVQAVQVGPAVYLANPAEYFCSLGLDIKRRSGFPFPFVVELANGCVGYVPSEDAFGESGGGYETVLTSYSNLEITAGTRIADACVRLARQLKPEAATQIPQVEPATQRWGYGARGPEVD